MLACMHNSLKIENMSEGSFCFHGEDLPVAVSPTDHSGAFSTAKLLLDETQRS